MTSHTLQDLDRITSPERDFHASIQFVFYVQYGLHCQLLRVSQYAAARHIVLKGDLPIGALCPPSQAKNVSLANGTLWICVKPSWRQQSMHVLPTDKQSPGAILGAGLLQSRGATSTLSAAACLPC